ncbi:hypothetical protein [[Clostridium] fimetarium]|uniref:Anticodon-binding domain-containing protein n=1 Tax=[Clostridium] fimetarium TaxID=99656 RepID=A0A1I0NEU7_9FIRM|nr:hypothetical protein [[Clostridium] fimetarium]SEV99683.1 hypothetical protein SAMN05421659_10341 [[Clostridium] fimetarium]
MQNVSSKENIIHTQGIPTGLVIGEKKDINGRRALEVKNHNKVDYIYADELVKMLFSPL